MPQNALSREEILRLINDIEPLDRPCTTQKPLRWLETAQTKVPATLNHPRIALFVAHHGFAFGTAEQKKAESSLAVCMKGESRLNELCKLADADLRIYEMDLSTPTEKPPAPAMSEDGLQTAMAYGMMTVEPGNDLLAVSAFGAGTQKAAEIILSAQKESKNGLTLLSQKGGFEIAAITGAILATRLAGMPVLLEGLPALAALSVLTAHNPAIADHCAFIGNTPENIDQNLTILESSGHHDLEPGLELSLAIPPLKTAIILQREKHAA